MYLLELLRNSGKFRVRCFVRKSSPQLEEVKKSGFEISFGEIEDDESLEQALIGIDTVVHIVNIRYSLKVMELAKSAGARKIILIHTTGMYSKYREYATEYIHIENAVSKSQNLDYVILRPTMIYGSSMDQNMHNLIYYINNHNVFPVFGSGNGLMQPIHGKDVAKAIFSVLNNPFIKNKAYNISGGNAVSYRRILTLISGKVNKKIRFVFIPYKISLILGFLYEKIFKFLGRKPLITLEQIRRLSEDKNFSHKEAAEDFGFQPICFEDGITEEINALFGQK
ncbi:MAG TPA: NAD(P)H-binding protein [Leptospiraceae bacterium]|nr:NAD(P)H-binding protein [Leptospiraceae bacterium]HNM06267.1 NAD(P)H-binding protein [Leptospiraceae bacterium]